MALLLQIHFSFRLPSSFFIASIVLILSTGHLCLGDVEGGGHGRRLLSFKETPAGSNATFDCAPSGPCVPCQYPEKNDNKYRCSETGYRIPLKCVQVGNIVKAANNERTRNSRSIVELPYNDAKEYLVLHDAGNIASLAKHRTLLDAFSSKAGDPQSYITYRSCIPPAGEEKFSVLGFEVLMMGILLVSGSFVLLRRRRITSMSGVGGLRIQGNARF